MNETSKYRLCTFCFLFRTLLLLLKKTIQWHPVNCLQCVACAQVNAFFKLIHKSEYSFHRCRNLSNLFNSLTLLCQCQNTSEPFKPRRKTIISLNFVPLLEIYLADIYILSLIHGHFMVKDKKLN